MAEIHSKKVVERKIDTVLQNDVVFNGEINFDDKDLMIKGKVEGIIKSKGDIYISEEAEVRANIHAEHVFVRGFLRGDVSAGERIVLYGTARVKGDIIAPKIVMETGCQFDGISRIKKSQIGVQ